ncbi:MAG: IS200/IS605 family transposase [Planctomycetota bacterium]|jgi:putative transposase
MPQSLAQILVHLVFSTKNRDPLLADDTREELHAYIGGIADNLKARLLKAGSVADHIHLLIAHPRTCAPSELVQEIKTGSSRWLKPRDRDMRIFIGKVDTVFFPLARRTALR